MEKFYEKILLFCCCFLVLALSITYLLIYLKTNTDEKISVLEKDDAYEEATTNNFSQSSEMNEVEKTLDLYEFYDENSIILNNVEYVYKGITYEIPKITGLKNEEVQNKINDSIKEKVTEYLNKFPVIKRFSCFVSANFANVLSINLQVDYNKSEQDNDLCFLEKGLNYNLLDGNQLKIEDIFTKDTDILEIVKKGFYASSFVREMIYDDKGNLEEWGEFVLDEDEYCNTVLNYMQSEEKEFFIEPKGITFLYNEKKGLVKFEEIADNVVIYDKYKRDASIFLDDTIGNKDILVCSKNYEYMDSINKIGIEDNVWFNVFIPDLDIKYEKMEAGVEKENALRFTKEKLNESIKQIEAEIEELKRDSNNAYIYLCKLDSLHYSDQVYSNLISFQTQKKVYKLKKVDYEDKYKQEVTRIYRQINNKTFPEILLYYPLFEEVEDAQIECFEDYYFKNYNYKTGYEYKDVKDLFVNESYLEEKVLESAFMKKYLVEERREILKKLKYRYEGDEIQFYLEGQENFMDEIWTRRIRMSEFDKNVLKIFN